MLFSFGQMLQWVFDRLLIATGKSNLFLALLGIYSTPNFLFLFMIFLLIVKVFGMTLQMSQMESRQKELVQRIALDQKDREELELKIQRFLEKALSCYSKSFRRFMHLTFCWRFALP